ncbi:MAG TPA: YaiO family outer membrane beta-barrel protein [Candidatus Limnocylindria bacterium]|nr:YaiO family outer membrane beta-barrel protein [Candidatus Limnocylindria bacterium]
MCRVLAWSAALAWLLAGTIPALAARTSEGSIARLDSLLSLVPDDADLHLERSRMLCRMGRWQVAAAVAAAVALTDRARADAWAAWADAERMAGDLAAARRVIEQGLGHASRPAELWARLARLEYQAGRVGDARATMERALASDPRVEGGTSDFALYSPVVAEASYLHESLTNGDVWTSRLVAASFRPRGAWSYVFEGETVERPAGDDWSLRLTANHRLGPSWELRAGFQLAPHAWIVARNGACLEASWLPDSRWSGDLGIRTLDFEDGRVHIARAGVGRWTGDWEAGYHLHWIHDAEGDVEWAHVARCAWSPSARTGLGAQLFRGAEVIHPVASSYLRSVSTTGFHLTGRFYPSDRWGFRLSAGYADRQDSYARRSLGLGLVRHF